MKNKIIIDGDIAKIEVISPTHGKFEILVDVEDVGRLEELSCVYVHKSNSHEHADVFYAICGLKSRGNKQFLFHRFLMNLLDDDGKLQVDHINHNPLDNRKDNLRLVTQQANNHNLHKSLGRQKVCSSVYQGVHWHKQNSKWQADIRVNCKQIYLGCFEDELDAAIAYAIAKNELHIPVGKEVV